MPLPIGHCEHCHAEIFAKCDHEEGCPEFEGGDRSR